MKCARIINVAAARFQRDEAGATMVELAIVIPLFLLIFFGLIDFGRLAFHYVTAEKSMQVAARIAAVRPAACPGLPQTNRRSPVSPSALVPRYGTSCNAGGSICANPGRIACAGLAGNATADEIWSIVGSVLPNDATIANLQFIYSFDPNLGFLGGPYVPVVTVELRELDFQFVSPLAALLALAGTSRTSNLGSAIPFPSMSVSLPGEDLALGDAG